MTGNGEYKYQFVGGGHAASMVTFALNAVCGGGSSSFSVLGQFLRFFAERIFARQSFEEEMLKSEVRRDFQ